MSTPRGTGDPSGEAAQRHQQAPRLTARQLEALELLEGIANDPSFYLQMEFQPGDIQLLNNAKILHAREVGGALVGGASLKAEDFLAIVRAV